ncbi:MAG: 6,7-dimethyl-8-ribityllumazine synthase [Armatimonadetes bacterium]|nr:6,7-dimethyl-8-ribityllumazine synthase [Armatimonadota bacterium]
MGTTYEGKLKAEGMTFGIVTSRYNEFITGKLLSGALDAIARHGGSVEQVDVAWVPGSFELPLVVRKLAASGKYHAVIALGAVIRGATTHHEYVAGESAKGIAQAQLETGVPCIYGVVTADTLEQAIERAGTKMPNRGFEAAVSAIEMADLMRQLG